MIFAYDAEWQYPAITEQHAYLQAKQLLPQSSEAVYVGFPWATLFDAVARQASHLAHLEGELDKLKDYIPEGVRVVTVCQHINLEKHLGFLKRFGITDVFWAHARGQGSFLPGSRVRAWPFPLYPVQQFEPRPLDERDIRFSFVGATSNRWYLTQSRAWIGELLADAPGAVVTLRDKWHFNKVVYDHQIHRTVGEDSGPLTSEQATEEYKDILARSVFALCPSGTGPNSIRLWECIQAGIVPVLLADAYAPPGNPALWEQAVVWCRESKADIRELPARLEALAADADAMAAKQHALAQLRLCYGAASFVYDLVAFFSNPSAWRTSEERLTPSVVFYSGREPRLPRFSAQEHAACRLYYRSLATALLLDPEAVTGHLSGMDPSAVQQAVADFLAVQLEEERAVYQRIFERLPFWQAVSYDQV